jgi:hypothetical protein
VFGWPLFQVAPQQRTLGPATTTFVWGDGLGLPRLMDIPLDSTVLILISFSSFLSFSFFLLASFILFSSWMFLKLSFVMFIFSNHIFLWRTELFI